MNFNIQAHARVIQHGLGCVAFQTFCNYSIKTKIKQRRFLGAALSSLSQFLLHSHPNFHTLDESGALVVAAERANGADDFVHLLQCHAMHSLIECLEVSPDLLGVHSVEFVLDLVQQTQWAVTIAEIGLLCTDVLVQEGEELGCFSSFELVHVDISPCFKMILQHRFWHQFIFQRGE